MQGIATCNAERMSGVLGCCLQSTEHHQQSFVKRSLMCQVQRDGSSKPKGEGRKWGRGRGSKYLKTKNAERNSFKAEQPKTDSPKRMFA